MVQAVNQRGRSPWTPPGQPHVRRYLMLFFSLFEHYLFWKMAVMKNLKEEGKLEVWHTGRSLPTAKTSANLAQ